MHTAMLFVPGNQASKLEKILSLKLKSVLLDLEDGVPISAKVEARALVAQTIGQYSSQTALWVRINSLDTEFAYPDVQSVVRAGLQGINLPKVEKAADLATLDWLLGQLERERDLPLGSIRVMATLETVKGIKNAEEIALSTSRLECLCFGTLDFCRDLGIDPQTSLGALNSVVLAAKTRLVLSSRSCGLAAPHDGASPEFKDLERLKTETLQAKELGFSGKHAIHPAQVEVIENVFYPSQAQLIWAQRIVNGANSQAVFSLDGQMIDAPVVARAQQILNMVKT